MGDQRDFDIMQGYSHVGWRQQRISRQLAQANEWRPNHLAMKHHAEAKELSSSLSINAQTKLNSTSMLLIAYNAPSIQAFPYTYQATLQQHKHGVGVRRRSRERGGSCTGKLGEAGGRGRGWPYCMLNHVILVCKGLSFTPNMLNTDPANPSGFDFVPWCMLIFFRWMKDHIILNCG